MSKGISKYLTYILRHHPEDAGLSLDENGYVEIDELVKRVNSNSDRHQPLTREKVLEIVDKCPKQRFELKFAHQTDGLATHIRACQGHSVQNIDLELTSSKPPKILYHGTSQESFTSIQKEGLSKMSRQHVHLSQSIHTAYQVGRRHGQETVILKINSEQMDRVGEVFFCSTNGVWLTDKIDKQYIDIIPSTKIGCGGFIVFDNTLQHVILVQSNKGHYGFPKGKITRKEPLIVGALRELEEETGIKEEELDIIHRSSVLEEISNKGRASVGFFIALFNGELGRLKWDSEELQDVSWQEVERAKTLLKDEKNRLNLLVEAHNILTLLRPDYKP